MVKDGFIARPFLLSVRYEREIELRLERCVPVNHFAKPSRSNKKNGRQKKAGEQNPRL